MNRYQIYCTPEQTRKAFELGAIIDNARVIDTIEGRSIRIPKDTGDFYICATAEQMIGWLEGQGFDITTSSFSSAIDYEHVGTLGVYTGSRKEATLAAIDAALEYLTDNKK